MTQKAYTDFMDEISTEELYMGLLAHGLFAEKLPPVFSALSFFEYCQTNSPDYSAEWHDYVSYSSMRNINVPRQIGIPNPMKYQRLCAFLREHWCEIKTHFHEQTENDTYRISRIHLRKMKEKNTLFEMNYKDWRVDGNPETELLIKDSGTSRYLVQADISTCFPSIYTHSLPWALVGKDVSKNNKSDTSLWYNRLDRLCQEMKDGETHGLLIGPHTSNLLSEIILTAVDRKLQYKGNYKYYRNIDDYDCYVNSYEEAQMFLSDLEETLKEFDLSLNHKKTKILVLPVADTDNWIHRLNSVLLVASFGKTSYKEVTAYLDIALKLMEENDNAAVLKYAIKTLSGQKLTESAKKTAGKRIMHLAILYPYLLQLMEEYVFSAFDVDNNEIKVFADAMCKEAVKVNNYESICYAIYFALKYDFVLDKLDIQWVINRSDCVLLIMTWLYYLKLNHGKKKASDLKGLKAEAMRLRDSDMDRYWLFCYEVLSADQLQGEWKGIKEAGVSFVHQEFIS